ncbi:pro-neuropeptide Y-like isoform X1 [Brachionus plicatilis]|uniref:Pro-neuropeptide Y-like isoform X1 n=1 Tax=Brachionus plicatilis TaxID=10195 RepID=A0A3M7PZW5_BRAPC|nr:pro-neuropeptide Y-like isoform X1 [Brachionus plicatilis]
MHVKIFLPILFGLILCQLIAETVSFGIRDTSDEMPERPAVFKSKKELIDYIKRVNEYYGKVGRPRFGKRNYPLFGSKFNQQYRDSNEWNFN